jgi:hypothetical protein
VARYLFEARDAVEGEFAGRGLADLVREIAHRSSGKPERRI